MNVREMRANLGVTQSEFATRYHIPFRTIQNWESGMRQPPSYMIRLLDEALMCQGSFGGRSDEYIVWVYGSDSVSRFNGVVVLGNQISPYHVQEKNGIRYTNFNRTIADALANETILDMQGITEAVSKYYYRNGNSFEGIFVAPEYQERFERLADEALEYYEN